MTGTVTEATDLGSVVTIPLKFKHYSFEKIIGTGASSIVCLVKDDILSKLYAAKAVNRETLVADGRLQYFDRELRLLQRVYHPHIIRIIDIVYLTDVIIVVMDYCENGDLLSFLVSQGQIMPSLQRRLFYQLVTAVAFLHSRNYAHRDIKPENIFIDAQFNLKLGDFGLSKETGGQNSLLSTLCGTMYYSAPEVLAKKKYDGHKADVWSLGIVLFCMHIGTLPWAATDAEQIRLEICHGDFALPNTMPKFIAEIVKACTELNPEYRPTAQELLNFQWLKPEKENMEKLSKTRNSQSVKLGPASHIVAGNSTSIMNTGKYLMKPMRFVNSERQKLTDLYIHGKDSY